MSTTVSFDVTGHTLDELNESIAASLAKLDPDTPLDAWQITVRVTPYLRSIADGIVSWEADVTARKMA